MAMKLENIENISSLFSSIAGKYEIAIETCSEEYDLTKFRVKNGKHIDDTLVANIIGSKVNVKKDKYTKRYMRMCQKRRYITIHVDIIVYTAMPILIIDKLTIVINNMIKMHLY